MQPCYRLLDTVTHTTVTTILTYLFCIQPSNFGYFFKLLPVWRVVENTHWAKCTAAGGGVSSRVLVDARQHMPLFWSYYHSSYL